MVDRRMVTDFAFAVLIALPAILPAAPSPWSADTRAGYTAPKTVEQFAGSSDSMADAGTSKWDRAQPEALS